MSRKLFIILIKYFNKIENFFYKIMNLLFIHKFYRISSLFAYMYQLTNFIHTKISYYYFKKLKIMKREIKFNAVYEHNGKKAIIKDVATYPNGDFGALICNFINDLGDKFTAEEVSDIIAKERITEDWIWFEGEPLQFACSTTCKQKVFEGDIIQFSDGYNMRLEFKNKKAIIKHFKTGLYIYLFPISENESVISRNVIPFNTILHFEVIGNIINNPELLF